MAAHSIVGGVHVNTSTVTLKSAFDDQIVKTMLVVGAIVNNERSNDRTVLMNTG